jgi:hypothetical protein
MSKLISEAACFITINKLKSNLIFETKIEKFEKRDKKRFAKEK